MKRKLLLFSCIIGTALFTNDLNAQINFSENFEGTINWSGTEFFESDNLPCEGNSSYVSDLHGGFVPNGSDATVSPSLGTSSGSPVTFTYNYKVLNSMNSQPVLNSSDWGSFTVSWGTAPNGPWTTLETINTANHIESANCAERTVTFTPAGGGQVYIRFNTVLNNFSQFIHIYIDDITATQVCSTDAPDADAIQTVCAGSTIAGLEADGDEIIWYTDDEGGFPLPESTVLVDGNIYHAAQIPTGGCESTERTPVTVDLINIDAPQVLLIEQNFCNGDTVGEIQVGAQGEVVWYATETSNAPLDNDALITSTVYYAAQIVDGCESQGRATVTINLTIVNEPTGDDTQEFIHSDEMPFMMPFSGLNIDTIEGATVTWYLTEEDALAGENGHTEDEFFTQSGVYYVTQTVDGCTSTPFAVTVTITLGSEDFLAENLKVYPNPVKDVLTVSYTEDIATVEVYNIIGQQVLVKDVNAAEAQINLSRLPAGT
jgi:hypothetical protein